MSSLLQVKRSTLIEGNPVELTMKKNRDGVRRLEPRWGPAAVCPDVGIKSSPIVPKIIEKYAKVVFTYNMPLFKKIKLPNIWTTFAKKYGAKIFQKSPIWSHFPPVARTCRNFPPISQFLSSTKEPDWIGSVWARERDQVTDVKWIDILIISHKHDMAYTWPGTISAKPFCLDFSVTGLAIFGSSWWQIFTQK